MRFREGALDEPQVIDLLMLHARAMLASSPVDMCHFLNRAGLKALDLAFFTLWDGDTLVAMGALKVHDGALGEIKSMRTACGYLGRGYGRAMLTHIVGEAQARGLQRLTLETGSGAAFEPALGLYRDQGFVDCPPFGGYVATDFNQFMTLDLEGA